MRGTKKLSHCHSRKEGQPIPLTLRRISNLSPLQTLIDTIRIHQQPSHILQPQPFRLRINRPTAHPPNRTHKTVNRKRPRRRQKFHHRQESQPHDKITSPVRSSCEAGAQGSHGEWKELALLPRDVAESRRVPADIDDHGDEDDDGPGTPSSRIVVDD